MSLNTTIVDVPPNNIADRLLIEQVERDARDMLGVAVVTSDKAFMANRSLFVKNGYAIVA